MFKLLRFSSIISVVAMFVVTVTLSFLYWQSSITNLTRLIEGQNVALAQFFANTIWPKYAKYVNSVSDLEGNILRARPETQEIHAILKDLTSGLPVLEVKMYSLDALTVYSSQYSQIGKSKKGNSGFEATLRQESPTTKTSFRETFQSFDGQVTNRHLVESYLPIHGSDGQLEGIFEFYTDVTPFIGDIKKTTAMVVLALLLSMGLSYSALFGIIRHARSIIIKQQINLRHAEIQANTANIAKSNFLSKMRHEIRTPLNGVLGLAQLLTHTNLNQNQRQKVDSILISGETLLAIINDVLDMNEIVSGSLVIKEKAFNLSNLMSMVAAPFQRLAADNGLILTVNDTVSSGLVVRGDPVRLRQVLWNLLSNAIKFTDKGSVTLTIEQEEDTGNEGLEKKDFLLHFSVEDTGMGIASDRINAIFDAFSQEDSSISRKHGGTGLGLSIVKQLTELMGGIINAESELGKGTKFDVLLPFTEVTEYEIPDLPRQNITDTIEQIAPLNVLVVEDNQINALIARTIIEKSGCKVRHVENGKLAVEVAKEGWANLIFMDIQMPEMNGVDATKIIRSSEFGASLPIVGLTAETCQDKHTKFLEAGMNSIITKPFTEQQLVNILINC